mgnify:CR=1 FL=1
MPGDMLEFAVTSADSSARVPAQAVHAGRDSLDTPAGTYRATRIVVRYDRPVPSLIGERSARTETHWGGTGSQRRLLRLAAQDGRYRMALVEHLCSPYWQENI